MGSKKELRELEELGRVRFAKILLRLLSKARCYVVEILDMENLKARRKIVRRELAEGKVISEQDFFKRCD